MTLDPVLPHPNSRFIAERLPNWLVALDEASINALGASLLSEQYRADGSQATWFTQASRAQQQALLASQQARADARQGVCEVIKDFQGVMAFTEPLLKARLKQWIGKDVDVHGTVLVQVRENTSWHGLRRQFTPVSQTLLMAALHNFNADQTFGVNSGLVEQGGYEIDYVPPAEAAIGHAHNSDGQALDPNDLTPQVDDYPLLRFDAERKLAISPEDFGRECRKLDLGKQYQDYLNDTLLAPARKTKVRDALLVARGAELRCLRQIALLKKDIDAETFAMLGQVLDGQPPTLAGQAMQARHIELLHAVPHDVVVFLPKASENLPQPCIVWMPGDSQVPLRRYRHSGAFMAELVERLRTPAYLNEFLDRISLAVREDVHARLTAQLALTSPVLMVNTAPIAGNLLEHLHERHVRWLQSQAQCLAIPTAQVDYLARLDRWEGLLDTGVNLLNFAAMFIPALGPVMLPVIAAQAMGELYHGLADLADHQMASGWSHLGGLALNIVLGAVVHQSVKVYSNIDPFVDNLLRVELPDGKTRLWHADITPYAADLALDPAWQANEQGLYTVEGGEYLPLDGKLYLTRVDELTGERVIVRPQATEAYQPIVTGNDRGAWLHTGERPLTWSRERLLRRLVPRATALDDVELGRALDITGIDQATVRQAMIDGLAPPLELSDTVQRLATAQEIERMVGAARAGERWTSTLPMPVERLVDHPRWPPSLVLQVFEGAEPWGTFTEYGDATQDNARWVTLMREDFASGDRMGQMLNAIGDSACDELLGGPRKGGRAARVEGLQDALAEQLRDKRAVLFERAVVEDIAEVAGTGALSRDFPRLDNTQVRELVEGATAQELERLKGGRVPLRMAEEARALLRQRRINRAIAGVYQPALANADSEILRASWGSSPLAAQLDRAEVARLLGISSASRPGFRSPVRVGARIGYLASGRGRLPAFSAALVDKVETLYPNLELGEIDQLLRGLDMTEPQLQQWLRARELELKVQQKELAQWVSDGKVKYGKGSASALNRAHVSEALNRALRRVTPRVVAHGGERVGFELDLTGLRLDEVPALSADFSHVKSLSLHSNRLVEAPERFLGHFTGLRHLNMGNNQLTALPEALAQMPGLTRLRVPHNRIAWNDASARVLQRLTGLRELTLSYNPLGQAPDMAHLLDLRGVMLNATGLNAYPQSVMDLPLLEMLDLRNNAIEALPAEVLQPAPAQAENVLRINRDTHLEGNPLTAEARTAIQQHRTAYGNSFGVADLVGSSTRAQGSAGAVRWLQRLKPAEITARQAQWDALHAEPGAQAFFDTLDELRDSRDFQNPEAYAQLRERVWHVIGAALEHTQLREALFKEALHGTSCSDGATLLFSVLQVRTLVFEASLGATGEARQSPLLKLAKGLFRLDEVEKAAFADMAGRSTAPDAAEVQLVYRTRLATALDLPGQPQGMLFARTAEVSETALAATEAAILAIDGSQAMIESVASRDFWVDNLRQVHANQAAFEAHDSTYYNQMVALSADAEGGAIDSATYWKKSAQLTTRRQAAQKRLVLTLTQAVFDREVQITAL